MATSVTFNGVTYSLPTAGDVDWGPALTAFLQAIASGVIQLSGTQTITVNPSTTNAHGIRAYGNGTGHGLYSNGGLTGGSGLYGEATLAPGVVSCGDITSPARAAFRIVPQDAAPTGPNYIGDLYVTAAGVLRVCTADGTPGTWTTVGTQT